MSKKINIKLLLIIILVFLLALIFSQRVIKPWLTSTEVAKVRAFDPDEFQHVHSAWYLSTGQLPYRDYFEHHTPLLYFQFAPILAYLKPESSFSAAKAALIVLRKMMTFWVAFILISVIAIGWIWIEGIKGLLIGVSAAAFLANMNHFWIKMIEIRPDVPAVALYLAAVFLFLFGFKFGSNSDIKISKINLKIFFLAGFLLSVATLHTQKILFAGPGAAFFWLWYVSDQRWGLDFKKRMLQFCSATFGFLAPIVLIIVYYAYQGGLYNFYYYNLIFNFNWLNKFAPDHFLRGLWKSSYLILSLALFGYLTLSILSFTKAARFRKDAFLLLTAASTFAGLWLVPEPYLQCFQYSLPLIAIFAASFMTSIAYCLANMVFRSFDYARGAGSAGSPNSEIKNLKVVVFAALLNCTLIFYYTTPSVALRVSKMASNKGQLQGIVWVMNNTTTEDYIMDAWPLYGMFRKHAWFYWTTHNPVFKMIPERELKSFTEDIVAGKISPKLFKNTGFFLRMPKELKDYVKNNYTLNAQNYWIRNK